MQIVGKTQRIYDDYLASRIKNVVQRLKSNCMAVSSGISRISKCGMQEVGIINQNKRPTVYNILPPRAE